MAAGFAVLGVLIAVVVISATYYEHTHKTSWEIESISMLVFLFFPTSMGLMATEHASAPEQFVICIAVTVMNGVWYWFLGRVVSPLFTRDEKVALKK